MVELNSEIINHFEKVIPKLNRNLLNKSIILNWDSEHPEKFNETYLRSFLFKMYSVSYLEDLLQLYLEIRYSYIRFLCHSDLYFKQDNEKNILTEHKWKLKYYADSAIYRYYSVWELIGRFLNSYFNLKLDQNKKHEEKERKFNFKGDVEKTVIRKYYHQLLGKIFALYEEGQKILDYRIIKTHKKNPKLEGASAFEMVKELTGNSTKFILTQEKEISVDNLKDLCELSYNLSREAIEVCGMFFDIGHDETEKLENEKDIPQSKIYVPTPDEIMKINSMLLKRFGKKL